MPIKKVLKAYEQVASQLRDMILSGEMMPGDRLPSEADLGKEFAVSRATIREALRSLASEQLIITSQGPAGGSFIAMPSIDDISGFLHSSIGLLTRAQEVSLEDFIRVRALIEIEAARLAAERCSPQGAERLAQSVPGDVEPAGPRGRFAHDRDFHRTVLEISQNILLMIAAEPVFAVLQTNLVRSSIDSGFYGMVDEHHRSIAEAIAAHQPDRAAAEMEAHLLALKPTYERIWNQVVRRDKGH